MRTASAGLIGVALMLALGCSVNPQLPAGTIRGQWLSTFSSQFVDLALEQQDGQVHGQARLHPGDVGTPYQVSGTFQGAELNATLHRDAAATITLKGTLRGDTLAAVFNGGELSNRFVPLVRP